MQQGAIFDMDGLLFDTEKMYQHGWLVVADEFGVPRSPELGKACCGTSGETMAAVVHSFYPTVDAYAYSRRVAEYVRDEAAKNLPIMPGARELLHYFRAHGVRIATASSSTVAQIEKNLAQSGLWSSGGNPPPIFFCARLRQSRSHRRTAMSLRMATMGCAVHRQRAVWR